MHCWYILEGWSRCYEPGAHGIGMHQADRSEDKDLTWSNKPDEESNKLCNADLALIIVADQRSAAILQRLHLRLKLYSTSTLFFATNLSHTHEIPKAKGWVISEVDKRNILQLEIPIASSKGCEEIQLVTAITKLQ